MIKIFAGWWEMDVKSFEELYATITHEGSSKQSRIFDFSLEKLFEAENKIVDYLQRALERKILNKEEGYPLIMSIKHGNGFIMKTFNVVPRVFYRALDDLINKGYVKYKYVKREDKLTVFMSEELYAQTIKEIREKQEEKRKTIIIEV
ncbi:MAG: hypothetical protein ACPLZG_12940 [Thermoproteota archaeon]